MIVILICVAWFVLACVAVAELREWRLPRREPEVESKEGGIAAATGLDEDTVVGT